MDSLNRSEPAWHYGHGQMSPGTPSGLVSDDIVPFVASTAGGTDDHGRPDRRLVGRLWGRSAGPTTTELRRVPTSVSMLQTAARDL